MSANSQAFANNLTAPTTLLRRAFGVFGNEQRTSFLDFVREHWPHHPNCSVVSRQRQLVIAEHKGKVQIFDDNHAVGSCQFGREFVPEVAALVAYLFVQPGNVISGLIPTTAKAFAAAHLALPHAQLGQRQAEPARVVDNCAVTEGQQVIQANVDTDGRAGVRRWFRVWQFQHQDHVKVAASAFENYVFYCGIGGNWAMQADTNIAHMLDVKPVALNLAAIAVPVLNRLEAMTSFEARQATLTAVKRLVAFIKAAQHLLNRGGIEQAHFVRAGLAFIAHPGPLVKVTDRLATAIPVPAALVQRIVVDGLHLKENVVQDVALFGCRVKAVLVGQSHLIVVFLLINIPLDCSSGNCSSRANVVTSCPHIRQPTFEPRKLFSQHKRCVPFKSVHNLVRGKRWRKRANKCTWST